MATGKIGNFTADRMAMGKSGNFTADLVAMGKIKNLPADLGEDVRSGPRSIVTIVAQPSFVYKGLIAESIYSTLLGSVLGILGIYECCHFLHLSVSRCGEYTQYRENRRGP